MSNYQSMAKRIRAAGSGKEMDKIEASLDRLWNAGVFTTREVLRLHVLIMDQAISNAERSAP
jgi:exonuclease VII large subunit